VTFDAVAWARQLAGEPGPPEAVADEGPAASGTIEIDETSLIAAVEPALSAAAVEERLRDAGLTLGLFPERYELASVGELVDGDDPGAGATACGFASLCVGRDGDRILLGVRRRPEAQAGRGLLVSDFGGGIEALRLAAQAEALPQIALLADRGSADLWLRVAGDPDGAVASLGGDNALVVLVASGRHGEAAPVVERAIVALGDAVVEDLGQNVARAWTGARYELARLTASLATAGYDLSSERAWHRWSALAEAAAAADGIGREITAAGLHGAVLQRRRLRARSPT
jgi:hypothetical protein